jgi:hypothetical protein
MGAVGFGSKDGLDCYRGSKISDRVKSVGQ